MSEEGREQDYAPSPCSSLAPPPPLQALRQNGGPMLFWEANGGSLLTSLLASSDRPIRLSCAVLLLRLVRPALTVLQLLTTLQQHQLASDSLELVKITSSFPEVRHFACPSLANFSLPFCHLPHKLCCSAFTKDQQLPTEAS
eukprot:762912-Hanusia_phi.AAC.2